MYPLGGETLAASNAILAPLTEEPSVIMRKMRRTTLVSSSCTVYPSRAAL